MQMLDQRMEPAVCKGILYGAPDPLNSSYRISYNMLLNLMRVEDVDPEYLLRASFHQFQREKDAPAVIAQAENFQSEAESVIIGSPEEVELAAQYYQMDQQLLLTRRKIAKIVRKPEYVLKFLSAGRLLDISIDGDAFDWGVLVSCKKRTGAGSGGEAGQLATLVGGPEYILEVLLNCVDRHFDSDDKKGREEDVENLERLWRGSSKNCRPVRANDERRLISMRLFTVGLEGIERLSAVKLFVPQDITTPEGRRKVAMSLTEVQRRLNDTLPLLDPIEDLGIKTEEFLTLLKRAEALTERMGAHKLSDFDETKRLRLVQAYEKKAELLEKAKALREEARGLQTLSMRETMKKMKRALKKLGHVDANGVIQTKGRTACEINTAHELIVVELIFTGVFNDLSPEQCCALLSCLTFDDPKKGEDEESLKGVKSYLINPYYKLKEVARTVARVEISCGIEVNEEEFVEQFNPGM
jgi:ATP-dependent RNA helicase DOB1